MHWEERGVQGHGVEHSSSVSIFVSLRLKTLVLCVRSIRILELHNGGSSWCQLAHFCIHVQNYYYVFIFYKVVLTLILSTQSYVDKGN